MIASDDAGPAPAKDADAGVDSVEWRRSGLAPSNGRTLGEAGSDPTVDDDPGFEFEGPLSSARPVLPRRAILPPKPESSSPSDLLDLLKAPPPFARGRAGWRHLRIDDEETGTDLAAEEWGGNPPPSSSVARTERPSTPSEPPSSRRPLPSWRPKQRYSSYAPPSEGQNPGRAFAIKVLDSSAELLQSYRLRCEVFGSLGYLKRENPAGVEIDEYDAYSIPFGAIAIDTRELVGTLRLITDTRQPFYEQRIHRIVDFCNDQELRAQVMRPRARAFPSITGEPIEAALARFNTDQQRVLELSRVITDPTLRGSCVLRGLAEFGFAYAMAEGDPILLAACVPRHVPLNARYGFVKLPGTDVTMHDVVGQEANTIVCNTRMLPDAMAARVANIIEAMRSGEAECLIEAGAASLRPRSTYHFGDHCIDARPSRTEVQFGDLVYTVR